MKKPFAIVYQDVIYGLGATREEAEADFYNQECAGRLAECEYIAIDDSTYGRIVLTQNFDCMSAKDLIANKRTDPDDA